MYVSVLPHGSASPYQYLFSFYYRENTWFIPLCLMDILGHLIFCFHLFSFLGYQRPETTTLREVYSLVIQITIKTSTLSRFCQPCKLLHSVLPASVVSY